MTLNIDLTESMRRSAEDRAAEGGYGDIGEYIRALIHSDLERKEEERVDALLLEGLDSGPPIPGTSAFWEERRRRLVEDHDRASPSR